MNLALRKTLPIVLLGLATLAFARPASADYTSTIATFGTNLNQLSTQFLVKSTPFSLFDSSLGTLTSVTVVVSESSTVSSSVVNQSGTTANGYTVYSTNVITVTGLDGVNASATLQSNTVTGTIAVNSMVSNLGAVTSTTSSGAINATDISKYIGTGTATMDVGGVTTTTGTNTGGGDNTFLSFGGSGMVNGTITIYYQYNAVPEPASVAMLTMGLGAVAFASRVRRRKHSA